MASHDDVKQHIETVLAKLDELAAEDWVAQSFIVEMLIIGDEERGYTFDYSTFFYNLRDTADRDLANELEDWYDELPSSAQLL